jgi:YfiH family protein
MTRMFSMRTSDNGAHFAFTDRWGGVSAAPFLQLNLGGHVGDEPVAVAENRGLTAAALGLDPAGVVWMNQVHGNTVEVVDRPWPGEIPPADAVVTRTAGLALAVLVADCTPVLLADPEAGVVAAAHAGRPGMASGVVTRTVEAMVGLGAVPGRITAFTGPAVCGACYEVPAAMRDEVAAVEPDAHSVTRDGTPGLDVTAGVWAQLRRAGVTRGDKSHTCSKESADHFSYRRDGKTGRMAGYVWFDA